MQQGGNRPEGWQTSGEVADRVGAAMAATPAIDHEHLFHHRFMRQIGVAFGDPRVMKREKGEAISRPIETPQPFDLGPTEIAFPVVNHHIRITYGVRIGKVGLS